MGVCPVGRGVENLKLEAGRKTNKVEELFGRVADAYVQAPAKGVRACSNSGFQHPAPEGRHPGFNGVPPAVWRASLIGG